MAAERWQEGAAYEEFMGRWSRRIAGEFVPWLARSGGGRWLDVGSGTGALSDAIEDLGAAGSVVAVDRSEGFLRHQGRERRRGRSWVVADAARLPFDAAVVDVGVSGLVLNFVESPLRALAELKRVTRPGGVVAVYVWDYADGMEPLRYFWDAAREIDAEAGGFDEGVRFPLCRPEPLRAVFEEAGYREVELRSIEVPTEFADFAEYWRPFLGGQGPAPGYVASLPDIDRAALRDALRRRLPVLEDGSIELRARAWAVRGST